MMSIADLSSESELASGGTENETLLLIIEPRAFSFSSPFTRASSSLSRSSSSDLKWERLDPLASKPDTKGR